MLSLCLDVSVFTWKAISLILVNVTIDFLYVTFLTEYTFELFDREMELYMVLHVAALVLLSIAYLTDENLFWLASAHFDDIHPLVQGFYVDFINILKVLKTEAGATPI